MQVPLDDVLNEYRDHTRTTTDELLIHKAALKSAEKQIAELQAENDRLKTEVKPPRSHRKCERPPASRWGSSFRLTQPYAGTWNIPP